MRIPVWLGILWIAEEIERGWNGVALYRDSALLRLMKRRRDVDRYGDYILCLNLALNVSAMVAYGYQHHWSQSFYWLCVMGLNLSLLHMK
mgnify:CR=1 FL=1